MTKINKIPPKAINLNQMGESLFNAGNINAAVSNFESAVIIATEYDEAFNNLGVAYWHLGKASKAIDSFKQALTINPYNQNTISNLEAVLTSAHHELKARATPTVIDPRKPARFTPESTTTPKPVIRVLHNMARSGGTVICKCLGCMNDVILLSEIHPLGTKWFNPIAQAHEWFNLLTEEDMQRVRNKADLSFEEVITLINKQCLERNKHLVIRDWNHLDFTAVPFLSKPTNKLVTIELLTRHFSVYHVAVVRHPIDQWLSLRKLTLLIGKISLPTFLAGYHMYAEYCIEIGYIRYEDFVLETEAQTKRLCKRLSIPYDSDYINKWWRYESITGDTNSQRGNRRHIEPVPRRKVDASLLKEFENNSDYIKSIEILGYHHPQ